MAGEVLCEASDMAKQFAAGFQDFNADYQRINYNISKRCKGIERCAK